VKPERRIAVKRTGRTFIVEGCCAERIPVQADF
jgi:hypothetical protein